MEYKSFQFQSGAGRGKFCKRLCLSSHFNPLKRKKTLTSQILPQTFNVLEVLLERLL